MRKGLLVALLSSLLMLAGCVQLPPTQQEIQSKKFEPVQGKSVVYIVRSPGDSHEAGTLILDDGQTFTTYKNTFYRWEAPPGQHRIGGFAGDSSVVEFNTQPGEIYFVEYTVYGTPWSGWQTTFLRQIEPQKGRRLVGGAHML